MDKKILMYSLIGILGFASGCDKSSGDVAILAASQKFTQANSNVNVKIDILWVVDNSYSMNPLQQSLTSNFNSFIGNFINKGFDFNIAVTTTDAYLSGVKFSNDNTLAQFRDGVGSTHTGVRVITPTTPNIVNTFVTNALQGESGSGDERAFSSFRNALTDPLNAGFPRAGSFLAVIILSDEDDFSGDNRAQFGGTDHSYTASTLDPVSNYISFLDTLTNSTDPNNRNYSVSAVTVLDNTCLASHQAQAPSSIIGQRYISLANSTKGTLASICSNYATSLLAIQQKILELSTAFHLDRTPIVSSIKVSVDGVSINEDSTNGWTYDATANSIFFHGTALPQQGSVIDIEFDPTSLL
jgi:hypothetical protein